MMTRTYCHFRLVDYSCTFNWVIIFKWIAEILKMVFHFLEIFCILRIAGIDTVKFTGIASELKKPNNVKHISRWSARNHVYPETWHCETKVSPSCSVPYISSVTPPFCLFCWSLDMTCLDHVMTKLKVACKLGATAFELSLIQVTVSMTV